jgi:hypothetical protein
MNGSRREFLRLGRRGFGHPEYWRSPQAACRIVAAHQPARDPLARRLFRGQLRLARWHRAAPIAPSARISGKQTRAQPYFAANLLSLRAEDFYRWIEYCNSPAGTTTLAEQRAADGERDPLQVRFWGVGNEAWGCGGNFTPDDYATEFLRFTAWTPEYGTPLHFVGSGPNDNDPNGRGASSPRWATQAR